jgi:hypothetical protein
MFHALNQLAQPEIRETPRYHVFVPVIKYFFADLTFNVLRDFESAGDYFF